MHGCATVRISCDVIGVSKRMAAGIGAMRSVHRLNGAGSATCRCPVQACQVETEYAEVFISRSVWRVELLPFVEPTTRVTKRYARLISGLPPHADLAVARHTGCAGPRSSRWTRRIWPTPIKPVAAQTLEAIRYLGVDEVARAKGQDYLTLVYDLSPAPTVADSVGSRGAR